MKFAKQHGYVRLFSYQDHINGQRRFLVSTYKEFWRRYKDMSSKFRHHYEVIQEALPCHLYFDLEYNIRENADKNGDEMVDLLLTVIFDALLEKYSIQGSEDFVVELDSSTEGNSSVGFMAGAAVIVALQQLKGLRGIIHFTSKMQLIPVLTSVFEQKHEWPWQTIVMGACFLILLLITRQISLRNPKLFWITAAAPLTSVIISTALVACLKSKLHSIQTIGKLPKGVNPPSANMLFFSLQLIHYGFHLKDPLTI